MMSQVQVTKEEQVKEQIGFVFIHGAGLNSRMWEQVAAGMNNPCLLIDYPEPQGPQASRQGLSLQDYTTSIKRQVEAWDVKRIVIVAHSLGGVLALKLADDLVDRVAGFVAIGAAVPKQGGSFLSIFPFGKRVLMSILLRIFGTKPPESAIRQGLCNDLTEVQAAEVVHAFVPESVRVYTDRIEAPVPNVPKLYIKLAKDQEFSPVQQEKMSAVLDPLYIEWLETGHLPMLSRPDELRLALTRFLTRL